MRLIAEITDRQILGEEGLSCAEPRYTARAVLRSGDLYAVMHSEKFGLYSLPGGGIDEGEDALTALRREILEETGCICDGITELGEVRENRAKADYTQISYYYAVEAESIGETRMTDAEKKNGTQVKWLPLPEVVNLIEGFEPLTYQQMYLKARDMAVLREYTAIMKLKK